MSKILVFAGTKEGRLFSQKAFDFGFDVSISVATDYGKTILKDENLSKDIKILNSRLDKEKMCEIFPDFDFIVDATHPFAVEVSKNIQFACEKNKKTYFRLLRPKIESENFDDIIECSSLSEIADSILNSKIEGNIFISTGSKELECFQKIPDFQNRCFVRVLPTLDSIQKCLDFGFKTKNIIAMQGPFSVSLNEAMFKETKSKILITKESGKIGGFDEKIIASKSCKMKIFVVKRPCDFIGNVFYDFDGFLKIYLEIK